MVVVLRLAEQPSPGGESQLALALAGQLQPPLPIFARACRRITISAAANFGILVSTVLSAAVTAQEPSQPGNNEPSTTASLADPAIAAFFESEVRPLLAKHCWRCHGPQKQEGDLRLDSREALLKGGEIGTVAVPGRPDESILIEAVRYGDDFQMPPDGKLDDREIAALTRWVALSLPWPESKGDGEPIVTSDAILAEARSHWAFQPPVEPDTPMVDDAAWPRSPIDRFVLAQLEAKGLRPAPAADKRTLLRRATFDLTGLPPTLDEMASFLADDSSDAFARVIDRLLESPRYGERWGRHWLDVARYSDSNGLDENLAYANAYRYRDWVIEAFNADMPYDQFVVEQLAGDLLPADTDDARHRHWIATGFLTLGAKMLAEDDPVKMEMDIIDEQVDTTGQCFLGLTLGCARCHDHKFDPISMRDYYALAGVFKSTQTMDNFTVVARWHERPLWTDQQRVAAEAHEQRIVAEQTSLESLTQAANERLLEDARQRTGDYLLAASRETKAGPMLASLMNQSDSAGQAGALVIEAEAFSRGNVAIDREGYGRDIGVIYNAGPLPNQAEYEVDLLNAGHYQIELRYAAAESRPISLFVDGKLVQDSAAADITGSWNPDTQTWNVAAVCRLEAGQHLLKVERNGPLPHLDKLALVPIEPPMEIESDDLKTPAQWAAEHNLISPLIESWRAYLEKISTDSTSVLAAWRRGLDASIADPPKVADDASTRLRSAVWAEPRPRTRSELAARYGALFAQAEALYQEARIGLPRDALVDVGQPWQAVVSILHDAQGPFALPNDVERYYPAETQQLVAASRKRLDKLRSDAPTIPAAMAVEEGSPQNLKVCLRGDHTNLGAEVHRGLPQVLCTDQSQLPDDGTSGRLALAQWIVRPEHPLTSRVIVNRVWQWHFGYGPVRSPDNFGRLGEQPTHPALLDWLATRFVAGGWSIKKLHREIMLSAAYQMSTRYDEQAAQVDPDNRLLWRMNRRRVEGEAIRDALLTLGGRLDLTMGGSLLSTPNRQYVTGTASVNSTRYDIPRRSVYLPVVRSALYDVLQAFDFADPSVVNGSRAQTVVSPQALFLLNGPLVVEESRNWAARLLETPDLADADRIQRAYEEALARPATANEVAAAQDFLERYGAALGSEVSASDRRLRSWQGFCHALLSANEFVYLD